MLAHEHADEYTATLQACVAYEGCVPNTVVVEKSVGRAWRTRTRFSPNLTVGTDVAPVVVGATAEGHDVVVVEVVRTRTVNVILQQPVSLRRIHL